LAIFKHWVSKTTPWWTVGCKNESDQITVTKMKQNCNNHISEK